MKCRDCEHWGWGDDEGTPVWGWCWIRTSCPDPDIERTCPAFSPKAPDIFTTLSKLQAGNAQLRADLEYERAHANAYHEECGQWEAENEKLRAELEQVKRERGVQYALKYLEEEYGVSIRRLIELAQADREGRCVVQKFAPGSEVWIVERDEDGEATEVSGFVFVVSVSGIAIVSPSINDCSDLDFILSDFVEETASSFSGNFSGYPISDCYKSHEEAQVALRREQE